MVDHGRALEQGREPCVIADIDGMNFDFVANFGEISLAAGGEIIDNGDARGAAFEQQSDERGTDETGPARHDGNLHSSSMMEFR